MRLNCFWYIHLSVAIGFIICMEMNGGDIKRGLGGTGMCAVAPDTAVAVAVATAIELNIRVTLHSAYFRVQTWNQQLAKNAYK